MFDLLRHPPRPNHHRQLGARTQTTLLALGLPLLLAAGGTQRVEVLDPPAPLPAFPVELPALAPLPSPTPAARPAGVGGGAREPSPAPPVPSPAPAEDGLAELGPDAPPTPGPGGGTGRAGD